MPSWNELLDEFAAQPDDNARATWLLDGQQSSLSKIGALRGGKNVLFYASAFLQKPQAPATAVQITPEDINGFMSCLYGMTWASGLTLLLHTPGGVTNAAETIVNYLRSKFTDLEVIVPTFAMSAGTMISLAADRIVMGRQSQLGPIDPQFIMGGRALSARAVVDQFETAKADILSDRNTAHVWAPVLGSIGPALLQEAQNALAYGETMVANWLTRYMIKDAAKASAAAKHFNDAATHKSHGRRIDRDECRRNNIIVEDLEADQSLQEEVLTAYHLTTIAFEKSNAVKSITTGAGRRWIKGA